MHYESHITSEDTDEIAEEEFWITAEPDEVLSIRHRSLRELTGIGCTYRIEHEETRDYVSALRITWDPTNPIVPTRFLIDEALTNPGEFYDLHGTAVCGDQSEPVTIETSEFLGLFFSLWENLPVTPGAARFTSLALYVENYPPEPPSRFENVTYSIEWDLTLSH